MQKTIKRGVVVFGAVLLLVAFFFPDVAWAQAAQQAVTDKSGYGNGGWIDTALQGILYGFIWVATFLAGAGMTLLNWAMTPEFFSGDQGVLNRASIYESWRFIRDLFNIFFIFALLFAAFATIFQVEQYSVKKLLLALVLWALLVNFSFPISRFMIDLSNVPMYYLANQVFEKGSEKNMGPVLSATKLENLLLTGNEKTEAKVGSMHYGRMFAAIIFLMLFAITMLTLGVMFVIRFIFLTMLVIFSAVGFSGLAIPWFRKFANMWWDTMFKYLIYGPAATLLILISVRFFAEISRNGDTTFKNISSAASTVSVGKGTDLLASMAMYTIPIGMLWVAIGLSGTMALVGGGAMTTWGKKWANKGLAFSRGMALSVVPTRYAKGAVGGVADRLAGTTGLRLLTKEGRAAAGKEHEESARAAFGGADAQRTLHTKRVSEAEKKLEEARTSDTTLREMVADTKKYSAAEREAAVSLLQKRDGFRDMNDLDAAANALNSANGGPDTDQAKAKRAELFRKADKKLFQSAGDVEKAMTHLGDDSKAIAQLLEKVDKSALKGGYDQLMQNVDSKTGLIPAVKSQLKDQIKGRYRKENLINDVVKYEAEAMKAAGMSHADAYDKAFTDNVGKMRPKVLADQNVHDDVNFHRYVGRRKSANPALYQDVFRELSEEDRKAWAARGNKP